MGERDLARIAASWTIHGPESLADCLVRQKVLTADEPAQFEPVASRLLQSARAAASDSGLEPGSSAMAGRTFAGIDPGGRLARILGLASGSEHLGPGRAGSSPPASP